MYNNYEKQPMAEQSMANKVDYGNGVLEQIKQLHDALALNQELIAFLDDKTSAIRLDIPVNPATDTPRPSLCEIESQIFSATQVLQQNNRSIGYILDTLRL
jgi:hypothetical protein